MFFVFAVLTYVGIPSLCAQTTLEWEGCIALAIRNHPDIASAYESVVQAKAGRIIALSPLLPQVDSSFSLKTQESHDVRQKETYAYGIEGSQLLFDGFKTAFDVAREHQVLKTEQYTFMVTSSNVRLRLRTAFIAVLRAQELITITKSIFEKRKQNYEMVSLRYESGREHRGALLTAQAQYEQARFEVAEAERSLLYAERQLNKELGLTVFEPVRVQGDFMLKDTYTTVPDMEVLAHETPLLQTLILKKEAARYDVKAQTASFFPDIFGNVTYGKSANEWPPDDEAWSLGVSVSLPLFEGGERAATLAEKRSIVRQRREEERSGQDEIVLTLHDTWLNLQNAKERVVVEETFLKADEERSRIAETQYSTGLLSFDDWIIIENNVAARRKSVVEARANALLKEAYWVQAKGGTLDDEL